MASLEKMFKDEVRRLARSECAEAFITLRKDVAVLKRGIADHKRRLAILERDNKRLVAAAAAARQKAVQPDQSAVAQARVTAKLVISLRKRLKLSQADFARILAVNPLTVYNWEHKTGRLSFRGDAKAKIVALRKLSPREVKEKLAALPKVAPEKATKAKKTTSKKKREKK